jgi:hypothetical protein
MTALDTEMDEPDLWHIAVSVNGVERPLAVAADQTLLATDYRAIRRHSPRPG